MSRKVPLVLFSLLFWTIPSQAKGRIHYRFVLPTGYIGWIQLIFNDPSAPYLPVEGDSVVFDVPETGVVRTSSLRVHGIHTDLDDFYYRDVGLAGGPRRVPIAPNCFLSGDSHGGFGVMDTGGKGKGYSWFIFIGPPMLRAQVRNADWKKTVEAWEQQYGNRRVMFDGIYPDPGRFTRKEKYDDFDPDAAAQLCRRQVDR